MAHHIDPIRGFLPSHDPLEHLSRMYEVWDLLGSQVSALLFTGQLRSALERLLPLDLGELEDDRQRNRAMLLLSVLASAYVWTGEKPATRIPRGVAMPLCHLAERLGRPPIIAHASLALDNWRRLDPTVSLELDNLATLQLFQGGLDEQWFYLVEIAIEAKGGPSLLALVAAQQAVVAGQVDHLVSKLKLIALALANMIETLMRMAEHCDPHIFYSRIRPFLAGWNVPGVVYEGVGDVPQVFTGGSAAQSPLLHSLDAALGVNHRNQEARLFLLEMRRYMSPSHRQFIEVLENGPSIRQFVLYHKQSHPALCDSYNQCVDALENFRRKHLEMAVHYITHQAPKDREADPKGTGGTNFATWLGKARKETGEHRIV